jgi:hypothetical protein
MTFGGRDEVRRGAELVDCGSTAGFAAVGAARFGDPSDAVVPIAGIARLPATDFTNVRRSTVAMPRILEPKRDADQQRPISIALGLLDAINH